MSRTLILDFDGSVESMPGSETIPLGGSQETIRFGCRKRVLRELSAELAPSLDPRPDIVFMGSGDYHHVSYLLIDRLRQLGTRIQVVVFDNHPDNMRYPFGIHCGSWVRHVSRLPFVTRVHVAGIASADVEGGRLWENYLGPLYSGKVVYYCVNRNLAAMRRIGILTCRSFASIAAMLEGLSAALGNTSEPIYLSLDKDVLSTQVVQTNWDQGVMQLDELTSAIRMLQERIIGSDVVGDASSYRFRAPFKRFLSGLDRRPNIPESALADWQARHLQVNRQLRSLLSR